MDENKCISCFKFAYVDSDKKLFFFDVCKHKICKECLDEHLSKHNKQYCPFCKVAVTKRNVIPIDMDEWIFSNQKKIRARLITIFNKKRHNFENTPLYNNYLEKVEDLIYTLSNETDKKKIKQLETYIKKYEKENIKIIEENNAILNEQRKRKIHEIVQKEGNFYEIIKNRPISLNSIEEREQNKTSYVHILIKENPKLFDDSKVIEEENKTQPRPLNPQYKTDTDIPKQKYKTKEEIIRADISGGYNLDVIYHRAETEFNATIYFNT